MRTLDYHLVYFWNSKKKVSAELMAGGYVLGGHAVCEE